MTYLFLHTEKSVFVEKFGSSLIACNGSDQYIWKDQVCDTIKDCIDNEDERNCTSGKLSFINLKIIVLFSYLIITQSLKSSIFITSD